MGWLPVLILHINNISLLLQFKSLPTAVECQTIVYNFLLLAAERSQSDVYTGNFPKPSFPTKPRDTLQNKYNRASSVKIYLVETKLFGSGLPPHTCYFEQLVSCVGWLKVENSLKGSPYFQTNKPEFSIR